MHSFSFIELWINGKIQVRILLHFLHFPKEEQGIQIHL